MPVGNLVAGGVSSADPSSQAISIGRHIRADAVYTYIRQYMATLNSSPTQIH